MTEWHAHMNGSMYVVHPGQARFCARAHGRPVVVIDPEDAEQVKALADLYAQRAGLPKAGPSVTATITHALREFAAPTPPKPEEPHGLGAVVVTSDGKKWVRVDGRGSTPWTESDAGMDGIAKWCKYAGINAVRVLSEGVTR